MERKLRNAHRATASFILATMDDLTYNYPTCSNRLDYIDDAVTNDAKWAVDMDDQSTGHYVYDDLGRITQVGQEYKFYYNLHGLVNKIEKYESSTWKTYLTFSYDEHGHRLSKTVWDISGTPVEDDRHWYLNSSGGENLAVFYEDVDMSSSPVLAENRLMGVSGQRILGSPDQYVYAINDHLGNVRATVYRDNSTNELVLDKYADYYPWGMEMPGRTGNPNDYRHGYQGTFAERDAETNFNSFELRQYDARLARWMSTDPYYQHHSPYLAMGNNPVSRVDPNGGIDLRCLLYYAGTAFMKSGSLTFFSKMSLSLISSTATKFLENTTIVGAGSRLPGGTGSTANTSQVSTNGGDPPGGGEKKLKPNKIEVDEEDGLLAAGLVLMATPEPVTTAIGFIITGAVAIKMSHDYIVEHYYSIESEHSKNARPSTREKHEEGQTRKKTDRGGEKGDIKRRPPRKRPPGWKGSWPPKK